jgi:hypothetical protein
MCRFGKVLSGLQPTFELQCGGTINLTSVKTTRKLVSVALEVRSKNIAHSLRFSSKEKIGPFLVNIICVSHLISGIKQSKRLKCKLVIKVKVYIKDNNSKNRLNYSVIRFFSQLNLGIF